MNIESIITIITLAAGLIGAIAALVPSLIKLFKSLKEIAQNKDWSKIKVVIKAAIVKAEASGKAGADKKQMVIEATIAGCAEIGVEVDEALLNQISEYIEKTISFVNEMSTKPVVKSKKAK